MKVTNDNKTSINVDSIIGVKIIDYGSNSEGVAKHNGYIIFVPYALKDEILDVKITSVQKKFAKAEIVKIVSPSPYRVNPPCPYFKVCGGCDLQHVNYENSLEIKKKTLATTLRRIGGIRGVNIDDVVPSLKEYNYRNKITLHNDGGKLCMFRKDSNSGVEILECILTFIDSKSIIKQYNIVLNSKQNIKQLVVKQNDENAKPKITMVKSNISENEKEQLSFEQVNPYIAIAIYEKILEEVINTPVIINAYSGEGLLSVDIAKQNPKAKVFGIELNKAAHKKAEQLKDKHMVKNLTNICGDCETELIKLAADIHSPFTLILDPPRSGVDKKVVDTILKTFPTQILYLSCNPATLARDLRELLVAYEINTISPYDMFPQTKHLETLVSLTLQQ